MGLVFRPTSAAAMDMRPYAQKLADKIQRGGSRREVRSTFLLDGFESGGDRIVRVLELPTIIAGIYGGIDHAYTPSEPFVGCGMISRTNILHALYTGQPRLNEDTGQMEPWLGEVYAAKFPAGTAVQVGSPPVWGTQRYPFAVMPALSELEPGNGTVCASAILLPVVLGVDGYVGQGTLDEDATETTLVITRADPHVQKFSAYSSTDGVITEAEDGGFPDYVPTSSPDAPDRLRKVGNVEFSMASIGATGGWLANRAQAAVEYLTEDSITGVAMALALKLGTDAERLTVFGWRLALDPAPVGGEPPMVIGEVRWTNPTDIDDLPGSPPTSIPGNPLMESRPWMNYLGDGYIAATSSRDAYLRTATAEQRVPMTLAMPASMRYTSTNTDAAAVVTFGVLTQGGAVTLNGKGFDPGTGLPVYDTRATTEYDYLKWVTLAVSITDAGVVSLVELDSFDSDKYNHKDQLERTRWVPYGGATTALDVASTICVRRKEYWEVVPGESGPEPNYSDVYYPEQKQPVDGFLFVGAEDIDTVLVSGAGGVTVVALGAYMPWVFNDSRAESYSPSHPTKLTMVAHVNTRPTAYNRSEPFCQYAVGHLAVLVTSKSQFMSSVRTLRVAVVSVDTGAVVALSPALASVSSDAVAKITMTCYEQATVVDGAITAQGKLLLSVSSYDRGTGRSDGFFTISELSVLSWVSKEPSNTWGVYIGNAFAPAEIGVRMNLDARSIPALK